MSISRRIAISPEEACRGPLQDCCLGHLRVESRSKERATLGGRLRLGRLTVWWLPVRQLHKVVCCEVSSSALCLNVAEGNFASFLRTEVRGVGQLWVISRVDWASPLSRRLASWEDGGNLTLVVDFCHHDGSCSAIVAVEMARILGVGWNNSESQEPGFDGLTAEWNEFFHWCLCSPDSVFALASSLACPDGG